MNLVNLYQQKKTRSSKKGEKRPSVAKSDNQAVPAFEDQLHVAQKSIDELVKISDETRQELDKVRTVEFNIFSVRTSSSENELVTVIAFMMH